VEQRIDGRYIKQIDADMLRVSVKFKGVLIEVQEPPESQPLLEPDRRQALDLLNSVLTTGAALGFMASIDNRSHARSFWLLRLVEPT